MASPPKNRPRPGSSLPRYSVVSSCKTEFGDGIGRSAISFATALLIWATALGHRHPDRVPDLWLLGAMLRTTIPHASLLRGRSSLGRISQQEKPGPAHPPGGSASLQRKVSRDRLSLCYGPPANSPGHAAPWAGKYACCSQKTAMGSTWSTAVCEENRLRRSRPRVRPVGPTHPTRRQRGRWSSLNVTTHGTCRATLGRRPPRAYGEGGKPGWTVLHPRRTRLSAR